MASNVKKIVISGYYGFGNSGDEAVLHSMLLALRQEAEKLDMQIEPIVLSIDPKATERMHGVRAVHRLRLIKIIECLRESSGLISGGGSLLQDTTGLRTIPYYLGIIKLAQLMGKPTFIYSQGMGPIRHTSYFPMIRHIFERCQYISVRDTESVDLIRRIGVKSAEIDVAADPVMGLPLHTFKREERAAGAGAESVPVIGISVRLWHPQRKDLDQITEALRLLLEKRRVQLRFLPFHPPNDVIASEYIIRQLGAQYAEQVSIAEPDALPQNMLKQVSDCDMIIGMRLHSLIYAASYLIPMIGVSYDPKIDHFLQRIEMRASGSSDHIDPQYLAEEALRLLADRHQWVQNKELLIADMKHKSTKPAQQICNYLRLKE